MKRMYRKVLAILLAMALVMSSAMVVMADEAEVKEADQSEAVQEQTSDGESPDGESAGGEDNILGAILGEILVKAGYKPGDEKVAETLEALFDDVTEEGDFDPEDISKLSKGLFKGYGEEGEEDEHSFSLPDLYDALYSHIMEETAEYLEPGDETVISHVIGDLDEHEDGTVHLLAYFTVMNFDVDEECPDDLLVKNGTGLTELLTFELNEDGEYEVTDCITAEDGENYSDSLAEMCEYMGIDTDAFYEKMGLCDLGYVSDLHNFLTDHPEYDHIEFMGNLVSHEDLDNIADELFSSYLVLYGLDELAGDTASAGESAEGESAEGESAEGESAGIEQVDAHAMTDAILTAVFEAVAGVDLEAKEAVLGEEYSEDGTVFSLLEDMLTDYADRRDETARKADEEMLSQVLDGLSSLGEEEEISEEELDEILGQMQQEFTEEEAETGSEEDSGLSDLMFANLFASFIIETAKENELIAEAVEATDSTLFEILEGSIAKHEANADEDGNMHVVSDAEGDAFEELETELEKVKEYINAVEGPKQAALDVLDLIHTVADEVHAMVYGHTHEAVEAAE